MRKKKAAKTQPRDLPTPGKQYPTEDPKHHDEILLWATVPFATPANSCLNSYRTKIDKFMDTLLRLATFVPRSVRRI